MPKMTIAKLNSQTLYERSERAAQMIRARAGVTVPVAIVLGSGLGGFAEDLTDPVTIPYTEIPGFARSTVEGHAGRLVIGKTGSATIAAMQGRFHFYEGYSLEEVTFPTRVLKLLGVHTLVLTNAAGALNIQFSPGSLMVISDHLNLLGDNPTPSEDQIREGLSGNFCRCTGYQHIVNAIQYAANKGPAKVGPDAKGGR